MPRYNTPPSPDAKGTSGGDGAGQAATVATMANILSFDTLLTGEKARGMVTSTVSGGIATSLTYAGVLAMGLSAPVSAALFMHGIGSVLSYSLDILFAKRAFRLPGAPADSTPLPVPYTDLGARFGWLMRSFAHKTFFRFVVVMIIETLTALSILTAAIRWMDDRRFMQQHAKVRNASAAIVVAILVFILFGNILRFDWAYNEQQQPVLNVVVLSWMALAMLVFSQRGAAPP